MAPLHEKTDYSIHTVEYAIEILRLVAEEPHGASLQHLADRLGISRNKAFRVAATLETHGLLERESDDSKRYIIGTTAIEFAQKILRATALIRLAHPVLEELAKKHGEAIYMTVLKGDDVMFLDMADCEQQIKTVPLVGKRFPFFTNAAGKALKAHDSRDLLERLFRRRGKRTDLPDLERLESELAEIRTKGVAIDIGGLGEGIITVAVAVRDYAGKVVGAITLLGPSFRLLTERIEGEIIPSLREGAEVLSCKFGYAPMTA